MILCTIYSTTCAVEVILPTAVYLGNLNSAYTWVGMDNFEHFKDFLEHARLVNQKVAYLQKGMCSAIYSVGSTHYIYNFVNEPSMLQHGISIIIKDSSYTVRLIADFTLLHAM